MSAPSAGSARVHQVEQAAVITAAFADCVPAAFWPPSPPPGHDLTSSPWGTWPGMDRQGRLRLRRRLERRLRRNYW